MILVFYNAALLLALVLSAPWWLFRMATTHKYRHGLLSRLGAVPAPFRNPSGRRPLLWIHAVSVGEVLAISRLVAELDSSLPSHRVLISTTTRTGQDLARQRFGADRVFYCPLDLPWAVRTWLDTLRPDLLILAETEFWPNLLAAGFRRRIPVLVVNARISDRSWPRYRALRALWKPLLSQLSAVLAQTPVDAQRLVALGCARQRTHVSGNLKFDVRAPGESEASGLLQSLAQGRQFLIAGSTLDGEEAILLATLPALLSVSPDLVFVVAPRHPERFGAVAALLDASRVPWIRRSAWTNRTSPWLQPLAPGQVVLLDTIGELASVYSIATVAFIGGSLIPAGGHNPLEPAQFAVPIVMGPNYQNFRAIVEDLLAHDALCIATPEKLAAALTSLLNDPAEGKALGIRARQVFEQQSGATARSVQAIQDALRLRESAR